MREKDRLYRHYSYASNRKLYGTEENREGFSQSQRGREEDVQGGGEKVSLSVFSGGRGRLYR